MTQRSLPYGKWSPIRFKSNWKEYRHGSKPKPKFDRIFARDQREAAVQGVVIHLKSWRQSPFEREGECRAGIRQTLCLRGHSWEESDLEAASLVAEGLRRIGAQRPDWDEGQWHYSVPRENCARCGGEIDEADQAKGFRYCSDLCAKAFRVHVADQVPWDHELRRKGYWQIMTANSPARTCPTCEKVFKSPNHDQKFCSPSCLPILQKTLEPKPCKWCKSVFQPVQHTRVYCSMQCRDASRVYEYRQEAPERSCEKCSAVFRPSSPMTLFCSPRCYKDSRNERRRKPDREQTVDCEMCGTSFTRRRSDHRYCSGACGAKASDIRLGKVKRPGLFCEAAE